MLKSSSSTTRKQSPMFLSKFLGAIAPQTKSKPELLKQNWSTLQRYYENAQGTRDSWLGLDALNDHVEFTPIPACLENMVRFIKEEEEETQYSEENLETGPCLEILLEQRILEELVEFAKVDTPHGMRVAVIRFFATLITSIHAQILPERAVHLPLNKLVVSCHRLIMRHHETAHEDGGASDERNTAINELSLELVRLIRAVFGHFKGPGVPLMDLFFERGWCRGLGESVWRDDSDLARVGPDETEASVKEPRFDMFQMLMDYLSMPGETGNTAREAIFIALKLMSIDPEYSVYVMEYSGLCEIIVDRLSILFAFLPNNLSTFTLKDGHPVPLAHPRRQVRFCVPVLTVPPTTHNRKKRRRKTSPYDVAYPKLIEKMDGQMVAEEYYEVWEFTNSVARLANKRLTALLVSHLTTSFWHPTVCAALVHPSGDRAAAATVYCTEMIHALTDQTLLEAFLAILIGQDGGVGADLKPERKKAGRRPRTEEESDEESETDEEGEEVFFREVFVARLASEHEKLAMATLRLFDTVLETFNQFAVYNLVLRNFIHSAVIDGNTDDNEDQARDESLEGKLSWWQKQEKRARRVRQLVERFLSLMPLEDEYAKLSQPPLPSIIAADSFNSAVHGNNADLTQMNIERLPVNNRVGIAGGDGPAGAGSSNYDDYFLEAQERHQFALMAKHSWVTPYPPVEDKEEVNQFYEGLFLQTVFDQLETMLEQSLERNLMMTGMMSKIASILDRKVESVLYDWQQEDEMDGTEQEGSRTQAPQKGPKSYRRCLFSILEKITQEAQKRAEQVPNFETRLMLARRRGMNGGSGVGAGAFSSFSAVSNLYRQSSFGNSGTASIPVIPSHARPSSVIRRPTSGQSLKLNTNLKLSPHNSTNTSPTKVTTPVTLANPFAKVSHFVNAYIVLQEFCKEVAAVVLVKHASGEGPAGIFNTTMDGFGTGFGTPITDSSRLSSEVMSTDIPHKSPSYIAMETGLANLTKRQRDSVGSFGSGISERINLRHRDSMGSMASERMAGSITDRSGTFTPRRLSVGAMQKEETTSYLKNLSTLVKQATIRGFVTGKSGEKEDGDDDEDDDNGIDRDDGEKQGEIETDSSSGSEAEKVKLEIGGGKWMNTDKWEESQDRDEQLPVTTV